MNSEKFLVTGALGCVGAWTVKRLVEENVPVWTYDLPGNPHRLRLIMDDAACARVNFISGDITDAAQFEHAVVENRITHIVHLAALQIPLVRADPIQGARVNVVGTAIVFEIAKKYSRQIMGLTYASSTAAYDAPEAYPAGPIAHEAPLRPSTLYAVYKQANEGMARIYWQDSQLRSIGLRPYIIYGAGRDQGVTSTPTKAMLAAALGRDYRITYGGRVTMQYARDAADLFIRAARAASEGAPVYNLGGSVTTVPDIVRAIERAVPESAGRITYESNVLPYPPEYDTHALENTLGAIRWTPLQDGVRETIEIFRAAVKNNRINVEKALA